MIGEMKSQDWLSALLASAIFALIFGLGWPLVGKIVVATDTIITVTIERCESRDMFFSLWDLYVYRTEEGYIIRTHEEIPIGTSVEISLSDYFSGVFTGLEVYCGPLDEFEPMYSYLLTPTPFWSAPQEP
jgi:hypothetical protein